MTEGGEGLFAVRDVQPDTVISFYHGLVCGHETEEELGSTGTCHECTELIKY